MCKSFDVSLITGIYSYAIAFYLYWRNIGYDRGMAIVLFTFSTIQWLETFLWYDLSDVGLNLTATSLIPIVLGLDLFATHYGASLYKPSSQIENIIYIITLIFFIYMALTSFKSLTTIDPRTGSLLWGGNGIGIPQRFIFLILQIWPLFKLVNTTTTLPNGSSAVSSSFFSHLFGSVKGISVSMILIILTVCLTFFVSFKYKDTWGSNWCWSANIIALIQLLSPMID